MTPRHPHAAPLRTRGGFTLIELLIVVVIVGILASIAINQVGRLRHRAAEATLKSDLRRYATAQEEYFAEHTTYAPFRALQRAPYDFKLSDQVNYLENGTDGRTWWLEVTHPALTEREIVSCRMESANTDSELAGKPTCDAGY
jgi:prepilin-type N-terminal cleavage/methylation domain-containing protein